MEKVDNSTEEAVFFSTSLASLTLSNYRNYESLELEPGAGSVIITGSNGSGKTNILEAISFLSPGRGMRNARLADIDRREGNNSYPWSLSAQVRTPEGEFIIGTGKDLNKEGDKRIIKIDGELVRGQARLSEYFSCCFLTPRMDQTFIEGSTSRRYYLDRLTTIFAPEHSRHLAIYEHAKSERRKLLARDYPDNDWLGVLEKRMAEKAVSIAAARIEAINHLQNAIDHKKTTFPKAILGVSGFVEENLAKNPALKVEDDLREKLAASRANDRQNGRTEIGTHRSDFLVRHREKNMLAEFCSTGEQKAMLLSITLASARAKAEWSKTVPVLLLDEVVAHLDGAKRKALFEEIAEVNAQSWLTGTDSSFFSDFSAPNILFKLENSALVG